MKLHFGFPLLLGELGFQVALELAEHHVEGFAELAEFVAGGNVHAHVQIPLFRLTARVAQNLDRPGDNLRHAEAVREAEQQKDSDDLQGVDHPAGLVGNALRLNNPDDSPVRELQLFRDDDAVDAVDLAFLLNGFRAQNFRILL